MARDHEHDHADRGPMGRIRHLFVHDHDHGPSMDVMEAGREGIRATRWSLVGLGITAALQAVIFVFSGSVALLSDTLHNVTDALTAIPLWIAFAAGLRPATKRFTHGYGRAEDVAGLVIVVAIAASAFLVGWESIERLRSPVLLEQVGWVVAAGVVGAAGNELVARYRITVGRRIGSAALITDGQHARSDALTSLAVVAAGVGAWLGAAWVDPVAGLVVAVMILVILARAARDIGRRLLDAVDPALVDEVRAVADDVADVRSVNEAKVRWFGHRLHVDLCIGVDPGLSVGEGHDVAHAVEHELHHAMRSPVVAFVHVEPEGEGSAHGEVAHHHHRPDGL